MSSCFSVYSSLAPHHNLARYCIQASCPADQSLPQLDCFSQCSSHVTSSVAAQDWEVWASQLTTTCQEDMGPGRYHRSDREGIRDTYRNPLSPFVNSNTLLNVAHDSDTPFEIKGFYSKNLLHFIIVHEIYS